MVQVSIVRPGEGEVVALGPAIEMRILEDGSNTKHRLGIAVGSLAPAHPRTTPAPPRRA